MTNTETQIFESILNNTLDNWTVNNGLYEIFNERSSEEVQTNGYNLLESIRRLMATKVVTNKLR